jgi:hypothetical protein
MGTRIKANSFASWNQPLMYEVDIGEGNIHRADGAFYGRLHYEARLWLDRNVIFWNEYRGHGQPGWKLAFRYQKDAALYILMWE